MEGPVRQVGLALAPLLLLTSLTCSKPGGGTGAPSGAAAPSERPVLLATTTSFQDTGLLDVLVSRFQAQGGPQIKAVAVGTGEALAMGKRGDADLLVVHSPKAEEAFVTEGWGRNRRALWHNDFVIVGPKADPARIRGLKTAAEAFQKIAASDATFVSRADKSGTHIKEQALLKAAGLESWPKLLATGQGMSESLRIASEKQAYSLSDRGTWLATHKSLELELLLEGDPPLANPYHVIEVNPDKHPKTNAEGARRFADFLVSQEVQKLVGEFGKDKYGQPLFFPDAKP
ncbi:MAG: substrate-binding domain-containing protein [Deltaproteobacteria bacterium]|nr:substrate-binding domain-containing protein [Deltaproteobacteria bacterium]